MSKSLVKLLDNAIFPASLVVLGKFIGVILIAELFDIPFSFRELTNNFFSVSPIVRTEDLQFITSYSDLIMYGLVVIMFTISIIRAIYLHKTHIKPSLVSRLANYNLLGLIKTSYDVYHAGAIWLVFTWLVNILVLINVFAGRSYVWIGVVATIITIATSVILLQDVYSEIENVKKHPSDYNWA